MSQNEKVVSGRLVKEGRSTIITSLDKAFEALEGHPGTRVTMATRVKRDTANLMT